MIGKAANIGEDFIFAKLHGRWSGAMVGDRLDELIRGGSLQTLGRVLSALGINAQDRAVVQKNLSVFFIRELATLSALMNPAAAAFYDRIVDRFSFDNLKTVLRERYQGGGQDSLDYLLVESAHLTSYPWDLMAEARTLHEFCRLIPAVDYRDDLLTVLADVDATKDLFAANARLDALYYRRLLATVGGLPARQRSLAGELLGTEIDSVNIVTAMRNVSIYKFPAAELAGMMLPGGARLSVGEAVGAGGAADLRGLWSRLPACYSRLALKSLDGEPYRIENALWRALYARALRAFKDYSRPGLSQIAYPFLKRFEYLDLGRLFEGLYLRLAPEIIRSMMVGLRDA